MSFFRPAERKNDIHEEEKYRAAAGYNRFCISSLRFGDSKAMSEQLKPAMFTEHVGTQFDVLDDSSRTFGLTLTRVVEHVKTERQEVFSLFFHGPSNPFVPQGIHKLN